MWILRLPNEKYKWSFIDGYNIFNASVFLSNKEDVRKYKLIDENGAVIDDNAEKYLIEEVL